VIDVAHNGNDRRTMRPRFIRCVVDIFFEHQQLLQLDFLFFTGIDETNRCADFGSKEFDHVVAQRLRSGNHFALLHEEANDVGRRAIHLGAKVLRG